MKAGLHCQTDSEESGQLDRNMLRKIGALQEQIQEACQLLPVYHPGPDLAYNEISVQMSGQSLSRSFFSTSQSGLASSSGLCQVQQWKSVCLLL
jgi:hypothetical protein